MQQNGCAECQLYTSLYEEPISLHGLKKLDATTKTRLTKNDPLIEKNNSQKTECQQRKPQLA